MESKGLGGSSWGGGLPGALFSQPLSSEYGTQYRSRFKNNYFAVMRSSSKEGSYLRLVDFVSLNSRPRVIKKRRREVFPTIGLMTFEH